MKKELLMSMLVRNARRIAYIEAEINDCKFWKDYQSIDRYKKEISKLAEIQKAIKVELRGQLKYPKKHGTMDANGNMHPEYKAFIENCKP